MRAAGLAIFLSVSAPALAASDGSDWPTYGHDKGGMRHSPLKQITPSNVNKLAPAWVYHMKPENAEAAADVGEARQRAAEGVGQITRRRFAGSQMTPLVVDGRMFISTPYSRVVALDPTTGKELWVREIPGPGQASYRGVEYWPGDAATPPRIVFGTRDGRLIALDAATGNFATGFGDNGVVNLRTPEVMNGFPDAPYGMTSPPLIYGDLVITGALVQESPVLGASGDVRAWDVRTGKLVWTFHSIPHEGEPNYGTWAAGTADKRSGVNVWGFMTVDEKRGIVYMPFGGPTFDRYGGDRPGDNLYGTSIVAADAKTGKYLWHYQVVRHDIWDIDLQSAPLLFDARVNGKTIPAVAVVSKNSLLFMFDRVTGKPLHPIEDRPVPKSDVPTEVTSPTQPFPITPPLARTSFKFPDDIADVTPELKSWCENWFTSSNMVGAKMYDPVHFNQLTVHFPGTEGGANWGGASFDPKSRYIFVAVNNLGNVSQIVKSSDGQTYQLGRGGGRFQQRETGLMCQKTPWGTLNAVDTSTGKIMWQSTLGVTDSLPEGLRNTGRPGTGGSITTAGGLLFIGFTDDSRFHAFDVRNGKEVWTYKLEASAHATPISYRGGDGRQFVAVTSTGGSYINSPLVSDTVTAFALSNGKAASK